MEKFIDFDGDQQAPLPYTFELVDLWSFPTLADYQHLQAVIDKFLNDPLERRDASFVPWALRAEVGAETQGVLLVMVLRYGKMRSLAWSDRGYTSQCELCYSIPVSRVAAGAWAGWALFTPYVFVDNPWSTVCGNTVIGYPKGGATFEVQGPTDDPYPIHVDALAFRTYARDQPAAVEPLVTIDALPGSETVDAGPVADAPMYWPFGRFDDLFGEVGPWPLERETYENVLRTLVPFAAATARYDAVQLKQIRDVVDPALAALQDVYTYGITLEEGRSVRPLGPAQIQMTPTASWPIADRLGLTMPCPSPMPSYFNVDYRMDEGHSLHS